LRTDRVHVEDFALDRDQEALRGLAVWATRFTPVVAPDPPDGLILDITGCGPVFRGEKRLVKQLITSVNALGFRARAALAPTIGCAWAAARFGGKEIAKVDSAGVRDALAGLPVAALRLDHDTQSGLYEIGIETIGHLFNLPRSMLPSRFGEGLLLRLDQALGEAIEVIEPVRPVEPARVEMVFDGPTTVLESIACAARRLLESLAAELARRESGVRLLDVVLGRSDAPPVLLEVALSRPSRNVAHLWSLLWPRIEKANLGFGVERVTLTASRIGRVRHRQMEVLSADGSASFREISAGAGEMIDTLANRIGKERITRVEVRESHVPERVFVHCAALDERAGRAEPGAVVDADRPSLLFRDPESAEAIALVPDGPPSVLRWRGGAFPIVRAVGPERVAGEWWREGGGSRDYFKVQDAAGRWLWVFRRTGTARWFVHGQWA
jgi:protein ImuB